MLKKKRTWIILGIVAVVLIGGGVFVATRTANSQTGMSQLLANAETASVIQTTLFTSVDSTGSIIPEAELDLLFGTAGTVEVVKVAVGDQVKQGDVLATLDATDLQLQVTKAEQSYLLQQLTYSETAQADTGDIEIAQASYNSALAAYNAAHQDYGTLADKEVVQCSVLSGAKASLDRAQTAYDRIANDHQASQYLNGDWGPFQNVVDGLTNAQAAYEQAVANCNITKLNLNDSSLRSAQAQLQSAKSNLDSLLNPRVETQIQASAALEQARLSLEQAKRSLADALITAPFDGVITAVNIIAGGSSGNSAAISIADTSQLHVDALVDETEIANVQVGQQAQVTLDALSGITLTGTVVNIDPSGTVSNGVVNYSVRVNLDPSEAPLKLDMTANTSLIGEKAENVLAVPTTAIRAGRAMNRSTAQSSEAANTASSMVMVLKDGQPRPVPVTVGMTAGDLTEVSGDLQAGDEVLIVTTSTNSDTQDFGPPDGAPNGGVGGPPPDGGMGGPPPGG